ncbi:hypothetical protein C8J56DRAFT_935171 [Mycena floridula]|nr:hypothetical protein C8J56DRAFT_935171 [Mycena floridula]
MAKSLRSKAKRDYRAKKRTDGAGVYAATEAARLHRLNAKLKKLISNEEETIQEQEDIPGWCWSAAFGLLDASEITIDTMSEIGALETNLMTPFCASHLANGH